MKAPKDIDVGTIHKMKCGDIEVISYQGAFKIGVRFLSTGYETVAPSSQIRAGSVKDPLSPSVCGVGFIGCGDNHASVNGVGTKAYVTWQAMIKRCYDLEHQRKYPTYKGCSVCCEWFNFQSFADWHKSNYPNDGKRHDIDKDLLVAGNKVYSPETCIFLPKWLNTFTIDRGASRGEYPIGVSFDKRVGKYQARCSINGRGKHLGCFPSQVEAHAAWQEYKLGLALDRKCEMDEIDSRIYHSVVKIIRGII